MGAFEYDNNAFERLKLRNKNANGKQFLGLFDFLVSENGNPLAGNSVVADFSETNSFRF